MKEMDYTCSHFDVATNYMCNAQPGEPCAWPDGNGGREARSEFHTERVEAARAMSVGAGDVPSTAEFDEAVERALDGAVEGLL